MEPKTCPQCGALVVETYYFCSVCGFKLRQPPFTISIGKQIGIYLLSALLPPLGLMPGIRYLMNSDSKAKQVGIIAIGLTVVSSFVTIWLTVQTFNAVNESVGKSFTPSQMQQLGL